MNEAAYEHEFEGVLDRIVYLNDASGWGVVKIVDEQTATTVTATGILCGVREGDRLRVRGDWVEKEPYGRQFQMGWCLPLKPETIKGIEEFLSSGFIRGMGRGTVRRLIEAFGIGLIDVMENHPQRLTEIRGIGRKKAGTISDAWKACYGVSDVMIYLRSEGIPASHAYRIFKFYGKDAARIIRENPYRLCFDIFGIGFKTADRIALNMGVSRESPGRAKAGIVFALQEISESGHVCYPLDRLCLAAGDILDIPELKVRDALEGLAYENEVLIEDLSGTKFVYLRSLFEAEDSVASFLKSLPDGSSAREISEIEGAVGWFEERNGIRLAPEQKEALASALTEKMLVITGGPGTGKTTLVRGIIEVCERRGARVHLCAPTGRAAKRLSEVTGREAKTIHRLFELNPLNRGGHEDQGRRLKSDMLIIDEASMVDVLLFSRVLKGIGSGTRLILVGDADQLPPVGPGNVLLDIIRSGSIRTVRLKNVFRQEKAGMIILNAHRINRGLMPRDKGDNTKEDYFFIHRDDPRDVLDVVKEIVSSRIPQRFGLHPLRDIQVLSPMHKGILGVENLNAELQSLLNPSGNALLRGSQRFREGDKVMQLRNNYENGVFNGDMGTILFVDTKKRVMDVDFEDRVIRYEGSDMDELAVAYACSIHKSQGNEYPAVVLVLHTEHGIMLQRNLIYTAVTRGKSLVTVVGNRRAIEIATANTRKTRRYTLLTERLRQSIRR